MIACPACYQTKLIFRSDPQLRAGSSRGLFLLPQRIFSPVQVPILRHDSCQMGPRNATFSIASSGDDTREAESGLSRIYPPPAQFLQAHSRWSCDEG